MCNAHWDTHRDRNILQSKHSINFLKLRTTRLALKHFQETIKNMNICIRMENNIVKAKVNRQGRTKEGSNMHNEVGAKIHVASGRAEQGSLQMSMQSG